MDWLPGIPRSQWLFSTASLFYFLSNHPGPRFQLFLSFPSIFSLDNLILVFLPTFTAKECQPLTCHPSLVVSWQPPLVCSAESGLRPPYPSPQLFSLCLSVCSIIRESSSSVGKNVCLSLHKLDRDLHSFYLSANVDITPKNQSLPTPVTHHIRYKRAIQLIPLLVTLSMTAGTSTGIGGLEISIKAYPKTLPTA